MYEHPLAWVLEVSTFNDLRLDGMRNGMIVDISSITTMNRTVEYSITVDGTCLLDEEPYDIDRYEDAEYQAMQQAWDTVKELIADDACPHPSMTAAERNGVR